MHRRKKTSSTVLEMVNPLHWRVGSPVHPILMLSKLQTESTGNFTLSAEGINHHEVLSHKTHINPLYIRSYFIFNMQYTLLLN